MTERESQEWLSYWLSLKAKQEKKDFNNLVAVKEKLTTIAFIQLGLKGKIVIEDYPDLKQLNLGNNNLEEVIIKNCPKLELIVTSHNKLKEIKIENCLNVREIYCYNNQLTNLDVNFSKFPKLRCFSYHNNNFSIEEKKNLDSLNLPNSLDKKFINIPAQEWLDKEYPIAKRAAIRELDISEWGLIGKLDLNDFASLETLDCSYNQLTELNVDNCSKLTRLDCSCNEIVELDVSNNLNLENLFCHNNKLEELNVTELANLTTLSCSQNELKELHVGSGLLLLNCSQNELEELELDKCLNLEELLFHDNNISFVEVNHLQHLKSLYCFNNDLQGLNVKNLKELKILYCANNDDFAYLTLTGCDNLEEIDCAENNLETLDLTGLKKLNFLSCTENIPLNDDDRFKIILTGCENLEHLNCTGTMNLETLDLTDCKKLTELMASWNIISSIKAPSIDSLVTLEINNNDLKSLNFLEKFPNLERLKLGNHPETFRDWVGYSNGKKNDYQEVDYSGLIYKMKNLIELDISGTDIDINLEYLPDSLQVLECNPFIYESKIKDDGKVEVKVIRETKCKKIYEQLQPFGGNILWWRNTKKIQNILNNSDNYSLEDLFDLDEHALYGVSIELREKLIRLMIKKEQFTDEGYESDDKNKEELPLEEKPDYEKLYFELLEKIKSGEITINNKEQITNSPLSEDKKEELYKLLAKQNTNQEEQPTTTLLPYILGIVVIILVIGMTSYLFSKKKKPTPLKH